MFDELVMHADSDATISWAWHTAAVCRAWRVYKSKDGRWSLVATLQRADTFKLRQRPLLFNAPRAGGFWSWPVRAVTVTDRQITAALGPDGVLTVSRFVKPNTTRLPLTTDDWVLVKATLNAGEHDELFDQSMARDTAGVPIVDADGKPRLDPMRTSRALLFAYLLDWSFVDDDGHVVEIRGQSREVISAAVDALDFESRVEVLNAIAAHDTRVRKTRNEEKKLRGAANASERISPLLVGVAGGTNG